MSNLRFWVYAKFKSIYPYRQRHINNERKKSVSAPQKGQTYQPKTLAHVIFLHITFQSSLYAFPLGSSDRNYTRDREAIVLKLLSRNLTYSVLVAEISLLEILNYLPRRCVQNTDQVNF